MRSTLATLLALGAAVSAVPYTPADTCTPLEAVTVTQTLTVTKTADQPYITPQGDGGYGGVNPQSASNGGYSGGWEGGYTSVEGGYGGHEGGYTTTIIKDGYTTTKYVTPTGTQYPGDGSGHAATHTVTVGGIDATGAPMLTYDPPTVYAAVGDVVQYEFLAKNHTVTESTFDSPCTPKELGFKSGFRPNLDNKARRELFEVTVEDDNPHWVYCGQKAPPSHCQSGMVMAINPPKEGNTFEKFLEKAKAAPLTPPPPPSPPRGGLTIHEVQVGGKPANDSSAAPILRYDPQTVNATKGDVIRFNFRANAHTVTQSSFLNPCVGIDGGFKTGLQNNTADIDELIIIDMTVEDDTKPLWYYCGAPTHCQKGMVFAINDDGKFPEFQQRAMGILPPGDGSASGTVGATGNPTGYPVASGYSSMSSYVPTTLTTSAGYGYATPSSNAGYGYY